MRIAHGGPAPKEWSRLLHNGGPYPSALSFSTSSAKLALVMNRSTRGTIQGRVLGRGHANVESITGGQVGKCIVMRKESWSAFYHKVNDERLRGPS